MLIDKESQIKNLKENQELLEGKIKFLQDTCKRAGAQIKKLEAELAQLDASWEHRKEPVVEVKVDPALAALEARLSGLDL